MVGRGSSAGQPAVYIFRPAHQRRTESRAHLEAYGRRYAHHGRRQLCVQLPEQGLSHTGRQAFYPAPHHSAAGVSFFLLAGLRHLGVYGNPFEQLPRYGAGHHPRRRLSGRSPSAAAVVAQTVFHKVGIVRVPGPEAVFQYVVVLAARVAVGYNESYRRAQRDAVLHPRQPLYLVLLLPRRALAAARHVSPYGVHVYLHTRRTSVYYSTYGESVRLAVGRNLESCSVRVHLGLISKSSTSKINAEPGGIAPAGCSP